jgi:DMSO/TMAO reductase YedYZ molybdopterin-dependent catalytic subunit
MPEPPIAPASQPEAHMDMTRRDALVLSSSTLAAASLRMIHPESLAAQPVLQQTQEFPETLEETPLREGFPVPLPLNPDGSAPEHPESAAGPIEGRLMWRTSDRTTPPGEYDYRNMAIRVDTRGLGRLRGTLRFSDLEPLPRVSGTYLMQCGAPLPSGIVKWTGVRFSDFADMLGLVPGAHYVRLIGADGAYVDDDIATLRHRQVMLAWMMNDEPLPPDHGAPLRLIVPFRYGRRSLKAITDIQFGTPSLPAPPA